MHVAFIRRLIVQLCVRIHPYKDGFFNNLRCKTDKLIYRFYLNYTNGL